MRLGDIHDPIQGLRVTTMLSHKALSNSDFKNERYRPGLVSACADVESQEPWKRRSAIFSA